jgi:glucokinase
VVSGMALSDIYEFVVAEGLAAQDPETVLRYQTESVGAVLAARAAIDPAADLTLSLFVNAYGAEAGNWALKTLPSGGLFVAGGIAPRLIERLASGVFMQHFRAKGRMAALLESIPVAVVLHPNAGLIGARAHALALSVGED